MLHCHIHEITKNLIISFNKLTLQISKISTFEGKTKGVFSKEQEGIFLDIRLDLGMEFIGITLL